MAVIQPYNLNGNALPYAKEELQYIEKHVKNEFLVKMGIENVPATIQEVISHLPTCHVVHFACHGKQDPNDPLDVKSSLILHNGIQLTVKEIMKQSTPNASVAYLSACETAMGAANLPDESVHLAASLLFAGFRVYSTHKQLGAICLPQLMRFISRLSIVPPRDLGPWHARFMRVKWIRVSRGSRWNAQRERSLQHWGMT
jgi:CHAT domain